MLGVCVKGDQTQKHPHWVFLSSKKGTEHKNTPPLVYFCPQYVLSTKPPMLGGLCARKGAPSMNTHTNMVFSCSAYMGPPVWVEDGGFVAAN